MYRCFYVLSNTDKQYLTQLANCACIEGDRTELITQIERNNNFCRGQLAINYNYFIQCLKMYTVIYIQNESDNKILGACSIDLVDRIIVIYTICVPDDGIKGIGTLLLNNVKSIGELINAKCITLSANLSVYEFYIKNGFTIDGVDDSDVNGPISYSMTYNFKPTLEKTAKGGKRKTTLQKNKKGKYKKTKKGNKNKYFVQKNGTKYGLKI